MNLLRNIALFVVVLLTISYAGFSQDSADVKLTPAEEKAYIEQARKSIENGSFDAAIEKLSKVIKSSDDNYEALDLRGIAKMKMEDAKEKSKDRDYTAALEDFTNAIFASNESIDKLKDRDAKVEQRNRTAIIYLNRGIAKMHTESSKYYKLAIDDFDEAFKLNRDNFDIYIHRSKAYNELREYSKELFDLRRLVNEMEDPKSPLREKLDIAELYFKYAEAHINDSNDKTAGCKYYKKALNLGYMKAEKGVKRHCKF